MLGNLGCIFVIFGSLGGYGVTFLSSLGALGVPGGTWDVQCRFFIDFRWPFGLKMGAFGVFDAPLGCSWVHFRDAGEQKEDPEAAKT